MKQNKYTRSLFDYFDVLLSLGMAAIFLWLWLYPSVNDVEYIRFLSALLIFEFVLVHSGAMMAFVPKKIALLVFFPIYGLFAWGFTLSAGDLSILWLYLIVVFNRMCSSLLARDDKTLRRIFKTAFFRAFVYFFSLLAVVLVSSLVPEFGLDEVFLEASSYYSKPERGLTLGGPHVNMFFGALYYVGLALFDIWAMRHRAWLEEPM